MRDRTTPYGQREVRPVHVEGAVEIAEPVAGFFRMRLTQGSVRGGVRIWNGPPHDPVTGEELDRSWRWQAECNGEPIDFERVWPVCAGDLISADEYRFYAQRQGWARDHAPDSAFADPRRKRDPLSLDEPLQF